MSAREPSGESRLRDDYFQLLTRYVEMSEESALASVADLGRSFVHQGVPTEEIAEIHEQALGRLAREHPDLTLLDVSRRISAPLMELLIGYGLAFRQYRERERQHTEALRKLNAELEERIRLRTGQLEKSLERLQRSERLASIGTLAAGIAHQINNPVGCILASAQYALLCDGEPDAQAIFKQALADSAVQAKRCGAIVHNLLDFSRGQPTDKWREDANDLARRACQLTTSYASEYGAEIEFEPSHDCAPVWVSPIEMEQVFVNLIRNAIESRASGARVTVRVGLRSGGVLIEVRDDGDGIEDAALTHIFDPFYTTRLAEGGTGLGLSVAHGIVVDHHGTIAVESSRGVGTSVAIDLPLQTATSPQPS